MKKERFQHGLEEEEEEEGGGTGTRSNNGKVQYLVLVL